MVMPRFHPDLALARWIPPTNIPARLVPLLQRVSGRLPVAPDDVEIRQVDVPGPDGAPPVPLRVYRSRLAPAATPALLWIHGGGLIMGSPAQDERHCLELARTLGIVVASVDYRLAPAHRAPAAAEDCYAALTWLHRRRAELGIDAARLAVGGASAGGGLAAAVAQMALDRGQVPLAFQLLVYPMLDDRTGTRPEHDTPGIRVWTPHNNRLGWRSYLGVEPGAETVPDHAVPARREDLHGLPPAWIGVGSLDLFHDEDVRYAARLRGAGVDCRLEIIGGAFHGFDALFPRADVTRDFRRSQARALQEALDTPGSVPAEPEEAPPPGA